MTRNRSWSTLPLFVLALALALPGSAGAGDAAASPAAALLAAHADAVVSVRFVLKTRLSLMGQSQDEETSKEVRGVLVDASGLVMLSNTHIEGGMAGAVIRVMGSDIDVDSTPSEFKVLFGNEATEHEARLVAKDSDLGLAFVQVTDLGDRKVEPVAFEGGTAPAVGQTLFGVTRMGRGFDCAPRVGTLFVEAAAERPRRMWAVGGTFAGLGMPVFTEAGALVGVLTTQRGSAGVERGEGGGLGAVFGADPDEMISRFVLPSDTVAKVIARARARAAELAAQEAEEK